MDLPDLKAKVRIDTSDVAVADAKVKAFSQSVRDSLDRANVDSKLQQAGQAFVKFGADGEVASVRINSATARTRADLDQLEARTRLFAEGVGSDFGKAGQAVIRLGDDGSASLTRFSTSMTETGNRSIPVISGLFDGISSLATKAFSPLLISIAAVAAILGPFLVELVATTAIVSAFAVGLAAAVSVMTLGLGAIGALGAGVLLLGNRTTEGQKALQGLTDHLGKLADWLGKLAGPLMGPVIGLLTNFADRIGHLGVQIIQWLGPNMQAILVTSMGFFNRLISAVQALGPVVERFFEAFLSRGPQLNALFGKMLDVGVRAVDGILTNLLRLSDWFTARLPTMGPIVSGIMGHIGDVIQGVGDVAGQVVDWFVAHWPQITETANGAWNNIKAGWDAFAPVLKVELPAAANLASQFMGYLHDHSDVVRAVFIALGLAAGLVVGAIVAVGTTALGIIAAIQFLYEKFQGLMGVVDDLAGKVWGLVGALGAAASAAAKIPVIGGALAALPGVGVALAAANAGRASGGPVLPGRVYTIGESGPETLVMGASGGYVIPNQGASGGGTNITINATMADADPVAIAREVAWLMKTGRVA